MHLHLPFACTLLLAVLGFGLLGGLVLSRLDAVRRCGLPLLFTSIYLGQMLAWLGAYALLPWNAALSRWVGISLPLPILAWASVGVVFVALGRTRRAALVVLVGARGSRGCWFPLWGIACASLLAVSSIYSRHLGALGLDTHQHIYWVNQILDAGHLPLVVRNTDVLAFYPKGFHLLVSVWSAMGLGGFAGPFVKVMPFLQSILPCLVFAELLLLQFQIGKEPVERVWLFSYFLSAALIFYGFAFSHMLHPEWDLNGTPRFSSGAVLLFPYLLLRFGRIFAVPGIRRLVVLLMPPLAMLLLAMNAVLVVQLILFCGPLLIFEGWRRAPEAEETHQRWMGSFVVAFALSLAIALGDPWITSVWAEVFERLGSIHLGMMGVVAQSDASAFGVVAAAELIEPVDALPMVSGAAGITRLFFSSVWSGTLDWLFAAPMHFPFVKDLFTDPGRILFRVLILVSLCFAWSGIRARKRAGAESSGGTFFDGWWRVVAGVTLGGLCQSIAWNFLQELSEGRGHAFGLLAKYTGASPAHTSLVAGALVLLASIALAVRMGSRPDRFARVLRRRWLRAIAILVLMSGPFWLKPLGDEPQPLNPFWTPVVWSDLQHLEAIEEEVADWEAILVPASSWEIGGERWIIPRGAVASVLPFSKRRVLFNGRLGAGVGLNWRDLQRFCKSRPDRRRAFLRRNDVHWLLLKGSDSSSRAFFDRFRYCGMKLERMGVEYPPRLTAGDLSLYRVAHEPR